MEHGQTHTQSHFCVDSFHNEIEETATVSSSYAAVSSFYLFISIVFITLVHVGAWMIVANLYNNTSIYVKA